MSLAAHCHHRCAVDRPTPSLDSYGNDAPTYAQRLAGLACRLVAKQQRVGDGVYAERPVVTTYLLLIPGEADVRQGDRIRDVVDVQGRVVDAGPFRIVAALPRRAASVRHRSYSLERMGGIYEP